MPASALPAGALASELMEALVIEGGRRLSGTIRAAGNKNGALPILAATLLTQEPVTLANVPRIRDVETMLELLADLGADVVWTAPNEVRVHTADVAKHELDPDLCGRMRRFASRYLRWLSFLSCPRHALRLRLTGCARSLSV